MEEISDDKYIALICTGYLGEIEECTIGELFECFFDNINYNVVKENNNVYVKFTGEAFCDDNPCVISISFETSKEKNVFYVDEVRVNNQILMEVEIEDLLEDIAKNACATMHRKHCARCTIEDCNDCPSIKNYEEDDEDDEEDKDDDDI